MPSLRHSFSGPCSLHDTWSSLPPSFPPSLPPSLPSSLPSSLPPSLPPPLPPSNPTPRTAERGGGTTGLSGESFTAFTPERVGAFVGLGEPKWQTSRSPHVPVYDVGFSIGCGVATKLCPQGEAFCGFGRHKFQSLQISLRWRGPLHRLLHYVVVIELS